MTDLKYYCDDMRHLVCTPYSIENLHRMAVELGVKRCWFHARSAYPHYDLPKTRIAEISAKCEILDAREILQIIKGTRK